MDLNLHTSIIVVAAILVLLIIFDGVKRMLAARAEYQRLNRKPVAVDEALDLLKAELPNGGARSVCPTNIQLAEGLKQTSASNEVDESKQRNDVSANRENSGQYAADSEFVPHYAQSLMGRHQTTAAVNKNRPSNVMGDIQEPLKTSASRSTSSGMASNSEPSSDHAIEALGPVPMLMESIESEDDLEEAFAGISTSEIGDTVNDEQGLSSAVSKSSVSERPVTILRTQENSARPVAISKQEIPVDHLKKASQKTVSVQSEADSAASLHKSQHGRWRDLNADDDTYHLDTDTFDADTDTSLPTETEESDSICATSSDRIAAGGVAFASKSSHGALKQPIEAFNTEAEFQDQAVSRQSLNSGDLNNSDLNSRGLNNNDCLKKYDDADSNNAFADIDPLFDEPIEPQGEGPKATTTQLKESVGERLADRPVSDEVLVMHVFSKDATGFSLPKLFGLLKACDLRLGEMSIFHRFERASAQGKIQFSVADVVKPGVFDTEPASGATTPGIALFLSLPGPDNPIEAYNTMAEVAHAVAKNLNGLIKDEMLSVMTAQTLEHNRQRIHEFIRRQQLLAKSSLA